MSPLSTAVRSSLFNHLETRESTPTAASISCVLYRPSPAHLAMMSSRMMNTYAMAAPANDVDFSFGDMQAQQPYDVVGFDAAGAMAMPSVQRPLLQHHSNLYDSFDDLSADAAGGCFPFQEAGILPPAPPGMAMAAMPPSLQLPLLTSPLLGVPTAAEIYHPFGGAGGAAAFLKREYGGGGGALVDDGGSVGGTTIGLNLGRRTYFSPADVLAVDRLLMTRSARLGGGVGMGLGMGVLGLGLGTAHHQQPPRCQAEGCKADLSAAKHYHRRHKVCEFHAKAAAVAASGKQQRFCQQCSRFHVLAEFDEAKRSCRKRLTEHNRRRRKPAGAQGKDSSPPPPKRANTCIANSCDSDHHHKSSTATAKSTAISPNGSGISCLDAMDNGKTSSAAAAAAAAPTALSLAALPLHDDDGGLDSMLMRRQVQGRRGDDDDEERRRSMTSLVMQHHGGHGGGNILSCSSSASDQQNGGCNGFFEVDFI